MKFLTAYCTDIGTKRQTNQDSLCIKVAKTYDGEVLMAVICDGMGGLQKGELASGSVVKAFGKWFDNEFSEHVINNEYINIQYEWENLIQHLNSKIMKYGNELELKLGTTFTAILMLQNGEYLIGHVGDSRVYKVDTDVDILTNDHTLVAREVRQGKITEEQAKVDRRRNILLQCVGASKVVNPDYIKGKFNTEETYMLCSDGFIHEITEKEILHEFSPYNQNSEENMQHIIEKMVRTVMKRGEKDNISVVVIKAE